ncbi:hypothetical protein GGI43DRAFT_386033 [Trichoderma evansii]
MQILQYSRLRLLSTSSLTLLASLQHQRFPHFDHASPSLDLEIHGDPVGWESDHQGRTALLEPGPGSWSSPGVLTTQKQMMSLVTLQLPGRGRFNPGRVWQLLQSRSLA